MKNKGFLFLVAFALIGVLVGCQRSGEVTVIHMVFPSEADLTDIPSIMALDRLATQGYEVRRTHFSGTELAVEAIGRGDAQLSAGSIPVHWRGIQNGADIVTVAEQARNTWSLVSAIEIEECADIEGRRLALHNPRSGSAALTRAYIAQNCPGTAYDVITISGSSNRAAALLAREVDVTPLELVDANRVQNLAPDQVHVLAEFGDTLPDMVVTGVYANRTVAEENPEIVEAYLRELLAVHAEIGENPDVLVEAAAEVLGEDRSVLAEAVDIHIEFDAWRLDGGLNATRIQNSLDFYTSTEDVEPGLTVADVAGLNYLESLRAQ